MKSITYIIIVFVLTACVKDKPNDSIQPEVSLSGGHKVYVTNEGNYGSNNASVSLYDLGNGNLVTDIYKTQNNNAALGDVCQSIKKINNSYYLVVNNSGKIVIVNSDDFKFKGSITGFISPRYILPVSPNKAYVSDLYANTISIIDLNSNTKTGYIQCKGWTEQMVLLYNKTFVTNMLSDYLYVVNTINDQISDSVLVGPNAGSLVIDKNSKLWVLSAGNSTASISGKLSRINPITLQVELSLNFGTGDSPGSLCINNAKDNLYFLNSHIYRMTISDASLPTGSFVSGSGHTFYSIGINSNTNDLYVSDAIDYIQKSTIMVYNSSAQLVNTFKAGINASGFHFE